MPPLLGGGLSTIVHLHEGPFLRGSRAPPSQLLKGNLICRSSPRAALGYDMKKQKKTSQPQLCPSDVLEHVLPLAKGRGGVRWLSGSAARQKSGVCPAVQKGLSGLTGVLMHMVVQGLEGLGVCSLGQQALGHLQTTSGKWERMGHELWNSAPPKAASTHR